MTDYDHRTYEDPEETEQWENDKSRIDQADEDLEETNDWENAKSTPGDQANEDPGET